MKGARLATSNSQSRLHLSIHDWGNAPEELRVIRHQVFVDEQNVPAELEWDATDAIAEHFLARDASGQAVAVGRLYPDGTGNGRIGRMAVARDARGRGLGLQLLKAIMAHGCQQYAHLVLSAQEQAIAFYQQAGFVICSDTYDDAGIPHRTMRCVAPALVLEQPSEAPTPLLLGHDTTSWQLETNAHWNAVMDGLSSQARRRLWLFEPTLDNDRYDREFLRDSFSELARRSRYTEIRLLIVDDRSLVERRHRLVELMRRLTSHIHLRLVNSAYPVPGNSFALIDDCGVAFRHQINEPFGFANFNAPGRVKPLADQFQQAWDTARPSLELRDLPL